jgi:hypothetical protein
MRNLINDVASQAYAHLNQARALGLSKGIATGAHYALFSGITSAHYLDRLQLHDFSISCSSPGENEQTSIDTLKLQFKLLKYSYNKKF